MSNAQNTSVSRKDVLSSFGWSYAEKLASQIISFVLSIILARLLTPDDYGKLTLVNIFITIMSAATLTGFGSALIQKKDATNTDFSSALYFSMTMSAAAYLVLFFGAPFLSQLLGEDITTYLRVAALVLIISSFNTVQHAYVIRKMQFYKLFIATMIAAAVSAVVGITMAYNGYGVWALVAQHLTTAVVNTVIVAFISGWRPQFVFSKASVAQTYKFGWKLIASSVMDATYRQLRSLSIGQKYTTADLAYYDRGNQYPSLVVNNIDTSIASVLAPALSRKQDDLQNLKQMVRRGVKTSSVILFPLLIGLAVCAEPLVLFMLTEKWLPCVPYLQLLSIALMLKPIQTANLQGIIALGRSDVYLRIQVLQKVIGIAIIAATVLLFDSITIIALGEIIAYVLFAFINVFPNKKYLKYRFREQMMDMIPQLLLAAIMGAIVFAIGYFVHINVVLLLVLQIVVGAIFYIAAMRILKIEGFMYLWNMMLGFFRKLGRRVK